MNAEIDIIPINDEVVEIRIKVFIANFFVVSQDIDHCFMISIIRYRLKSKKV